MGVPLCLAAFGEAGLPPAMLTVIVTAVVSMVFGVMLIELEVAAGPDLLHGPLKTFLRAAFNVARNPLPMSIALGIVVSGTGLPIPTPVERSGSTSWGRRPPPARCSPSGCSCPTSRSRAGSPKRASPP
jgi:predicted permease